MQYQNCIKCFHPLNGQNLCPVCGYDNAAYRPKPQYLPAGTLLNGRYTVGMALGAGGFGITYAGFDNQLRRRVAVKEYFPAASVWRESDKSLQVSCYNSAEQRENFETGKQKSLKEAQSLAQLDDIGSIVRVLDFFSANDTAYIIMEYVEGTTLKDYVKQLPSTMGETQISDLLLPVMYALKDMHERGFVHRDISPDNIMVTASKGKAKLLDFGAVKAVSRQTGSSTENPVVKRGFSPMELYSTTGLIGPWSDVYSMCATVFYLVTGTVLQEPMDRMSNDTKTAAALHGRVSPQMEAVLIKGLSIRPEARYQKMGALIADMEAARKFALPNVNEMHTQPIGYNIPSSQSPYASVSASNHAGIPNTGSPAMQQNAGYQAPPVYAAAANPTPPPQAYPPPGAAYAPQQPAYQAPPAPAPKEKKNNTGLIIAIGIGVIVILLIAIIIVALKNGKKNPGPGKNATTAAADNGKQETGNNAVQMSDDPFDFTFILDGATYRLPCDLKDFTDNGWVLEEDADLEEKIPGDDDVEFYLEKKGDKQISVFFYNPTGNVKEAADCRIGAIEVEKRSNVEFEIAKGITLNSTVSDVKDAFGTPDYESDSGNDYTSISYYKNHEDFSDFEVSFFIYDADSTMTDYSDITLTNYVITDDDKTETNTETPAYLAEYKAPTALGSDLKSGVFMLEGDLYRLPCPLSAFLDNGWTVASHDGDLAAGNKSFSIELKRNGKEFTLDILNMAEYQTTPENCAVFSLTVGAYSKVDLELQNKVKIGMAKSSLDALTDDSYNYYSTSSSVSYSYVESEPRDFTLSIGIAPETNTVSYISLTCETWDY